MLQYNPHLKKAARKLRSETTDSEQRLWSRVRGKQLQGVQFYRQKPIGGYIVDFYAPKTKLVVEVDGSQHLDIHNLQQDAERDEYLAAQELKVLRFNNLQVFQELDGVVEVIYQEVVSRLNADPPNPPLRKGG